MSNRKSLCVTRKKICQTSDLLALYVSISILGRPIFLRLTKILLLDARRSDVWQKGTKLILGWGHEHCTALSDIIIAHTVSAVVIAHRAVHETKSKRFGYSQKSALSSLYIEVRCNAYHTDAATHTATNTDHTESSLYIEVRTRLRCLYFPFYIFHFTPRKSAL